jgi:F-type H+-transporting ATPase subunit epsilon
MADTMQFDLVSPERKLASLAVRAVRIPGAEGDMTVMPGHAPVITTLRPGLLIVTSDGAEAEYAVSGGFAEITGDGCTVLAERAHPLSEMTPEIYSEMVDQVRARINEVTADHHPGPTDDLVKLLADMEALGTHIGLESR